MSEQRRTTIIGAGASGLMAAMTSAESGDIVTIIEHKEKAARKLLMTGNGKCNITNKRMDESFYNSNAKDFVHEAFQKVDSSITMGLFERIGLVTKEKNGYVYPNSEQAASVLEILLNRNIYLGVNIIYGANVSSVKKNGDSFCITYDGEKTGVINCDKLILAMGGRSYPKTGSDGSGYEIARSLGHRIVKVVPALTSLYCKEKYFKDIAGVRVYGRVTLYSSVTQDYANVNLEASDIGEIQLTNYGISGIPVFQVSRYASYALDKGRYVMAVIDLMPDMICDVLAGILYTRFKNSPYKTLEDQFVSLLNNKLSRVIIENSGYSRNIKSSMLSYEDATKIADSIKNWRVDIDNVNDYENAQISAGGVALDEINPITMESKLVSNLYIVGEMLDVDGICGGYNLQWAWTSGYIAGKAY